MNGEHLQQQPLYKNLKKLQSETDKDYHELVKKKINK